LLDTFKSSPAEFTADEHQAWETGLGAIAGVMIKAWDSPVLDRAVQDSPMQDSA